jgi:hypothetical protein
VRKSTALAVFSSVGLYKQTYIYTVEIEAMKMAPTAAVAVLLGLPPLDLKTEAEARAGIYRFSCNEQWKSK